MDESNFSRNLHFIFNIPQDSAIIKGKEHNWENDISKFLQQGLDKARAVNVKRRDLGDGSDHMALVASIQFLFNDVSYKDILSLLLFIYSLPSNFYEFKSNFLFWEKTYKYFANIIKQIKKFYEDNEITFKGKDVVEYYPLQYVVPYAANSLSTNFSESMNFSDHTEVTLKGVFQVNEYIKTGFAGVGHKTPVIEKSFYSLCFAVDNLFIFQLWDSHLTKITEVALNNDSRFNDYNFINLKSKAIPSLTDDLKDECIR